MFARYTVLVGLLILTEFSVVGIAQSSTADFADVCPQRTQSNPYDTIPASQNRLLQQVDCFELTSETTSPAIDEAEVRAIVQKALPFIEREGVKWMEQKKVCHLSPFDVHDLGLERRFWPRVFCRP